MARLRAQSTSRVPCTMPARGARDPRRRPKNARPVAATVAAAPHQRGPKCALRGPDGGWRSVPRWMHKRSQVLGPIRVQVYPTWRDTARGRLAREPSAATTCGSIAVGRSGHLSLAARSILCALCVSMTRWGDASTMNQMMVLDHEGRRPPLRSATSRLVWLSARGGATTRSRQAVA